MTPSVRPFPHDPAAGRDGSVWYTAQLSNAVGHSIRRPAASRSIRCRRPTRARTGLLEDPDGNVWYTGNAAGLIGKIDVKTAEVTEYKMPDPRARDPHSLVFSRSGLVVFTVQQGGFVGTLDPKTGTINLAPVSTNSRPYGIMLNSKDVPFFDLFGTNKIGSLDLKTMKVTEYPLPAAGARPRRIAIGLDDTVYYTDYARGLPRPSRSGDREGRGVPIARRQPAPSRTAWRGPRTAPSGTAKRATAAATSWCASIPKRRKCCRGRFRAAAAPCATWTCGRDPRARCCGWPKAASARSRASRLEPARKGRKGRRGRTGQALSSCLLPAR